MTQSYDIYAITNRFLTKSLKIINMAAILDLEIFTNVKNKYVSGYSQNGFLSTLLKII